jgi:hypothetical protein
VGTNGILECNFPSKNEHHTIVTLDTTNLAPAASTPSSTTIELLLSATCERGNEGEMMLTWTVLFAGGAIPVATTDQYPIYNLSEDSDESPDFRALFVVFTVANAEIRGVLEGGGGAGGVGGVGAEPEIHVVSIGSAFG